MLLNRSRSFFKQRRHDGREHLGFTSSRPADRRRSRAPRNAAEIFHPIYDIVCRFCRDRERRPVSAYLF